MTKSLRREAGITDPDSFYEALIEIHRDLGAEESQQVNARLILILANHIGDAAVLGEALRVARNGVIASDSTS